MASDVVLAKLCGKVCSVNASSPLALSAIATRFWHEWLDQKNSSILQRQFKQFKAST
jgi:hypothetical protein